MQRPYTAILIIPTGVGAAICGYAGDALPVARVISQVCGKRSYAALAYRLVHAVGFGSYSCDLSKLPSKVAMTIEAAS